MNEKYHAAAVTQNALAFGYSCDVGSPATEAEVLARARALAGRTLAEVAARAGVEVPASLSYAKGFVGRVVEMALGLLATNRAEPDFLELGVEVKTLPLNRDGRPRESTYVTTVELAPQRDLRWETSAVRKKLMRVLWVPVEAEKDLAIGARRIGTAFLWSPDAEEEHALREDYEELVGLIAEGWVESITAHRGRVLQIRPKGANAEEMTIGVDDEGGQRRTLRRGFYLRPSFTDALLLRQFPDRC